MSARTVRDALISQLQADTVLLAEFTAPQIKKGVESNFDINTATKGLRVALEISSQQPIGMNSTKVNATYGYSTIAYFYETDPEQVDDRMGQYDEIIREAVEKDLDLGSINPTRIIIGQTRYRNHPKINNLYFCIIPVAVSVREIRGAR